MSQPWRPVACVLLAALLGDPRVGAGAPERPPTNARARQRAQKLFDQGVAALSQRSFATAEQWLAAAYRLAPSAEALFYLGALAFAEGRVLAAQDLMRRYLADPHLDAAAGTPELAEAQRILAMARPPHGKLQVVGEVGTVVLLDGRLAGSLPLSRPLLVVPGSHQLAFEWSGGRQDESVDVPASRFVELRHNAASRTVLVSQLPGVLVLDGYDGVSREAQGRLRRALEEAVQGEHYSVVEREAALDEARDPQLTGCLEQEACQLQLAERSGVELVLLSRVVQGAAGAAGTGVRLRVLDAKIGELAATRDSECSGCSLEQISSNITNNILPLLLQAKERPRGALAVVSTPPGAEVRLTSQQGGRLLGRTPLLVPTWAGPRELELTLSGYQATRSRVEVAEGQSTSLRVELEPVRAVAAPAVSPAPVVAAPAPVRGREVPRLASLAGGSAALAVGLLGLGFGLSALVTSGHCYGFMPEEGGACLDVYRTGTVGAALTGAGSLFLVGGALLIAIPELRRRH